MAEKSTPKVLVIDGYRQEAREVLKAGGASIAADLYRGMLEACAPFSIECEYCFPSDPDSEIPADSELDRFDRVPVTVLYFGKHEIPIICLNCRGAPH